MVFCVLFKMIGQVVDPLRQQCDLHLGGAGVLIVYFMLSDDILLRQIP